MADADEISRALAEMMKPKARQVVNPQPPRPKWEATEDNAAKDAAELLRVIREQELSDDEATAVVASALLLAAGKLTQAQFEDRATKAIKSAVQRAGIADDDLAERLQESHRRRAARKEES